MISEKERSIIKIALRAYADLGYKSRINKYAQLKEEETEELKKYYKMANKISDNNKMALKAIDLMPREKLISYLEEILR